MNRRTFSSACTAAILTALWLGAARAADDPASRPAIFPGQRTQWQGFDRYDFFVDGCASIVVAPKTAAPGEPWVWRAEFFGYQPNTDVALLNRGFHVAYITVGNTFGCPSAMAHWAVFYKELTGKYGLSR